MSRESYFLRCGEAVEPLPFIKTETDLAFRPEGQGYVGGVPDWSEKPGWNFSVAPERFNSVVWPALAERIPAMQSLKLERSWQGHYAHSVLDYSPILGPCHGGLDNFFLAIASCTYQQLAGGWQSTWLRGSTKRWISIALGIEVFLKTVRIVRKVLSD